MVIRDATGGDIEGIVSLEQRWAEEHITINPSRPATREEIRGHAWLLVAMDGAHPVGYISGDPEDRHGTAKEAENAGGTAVVGDIYVLPETRSRGIGGALLDALVARGMKDGSREFVVYADSIDMDRLLKFYLLHGFHEDPEFHSPEGKRRMIRRA